MLMNALECATPPNLERPSPRPRPQECIRLVRRDGKENQMGTADEIVERHIADAKPGKLSTVGRIIAVIAHREVMTHGYLEGRRCHKDRLGCHQAHCIE